MPGYVLPAYAGMIRRRPGLCPGCRRAPRVCGDDPHLRVDLVRDSDVLPAYAGMILP